VTRFWIFEVVMADLQRPIRSMPRSIRPSSPSPRTRCSTMIRTGASGSTMRYACCADTAGGWHEHNNLRRMCASDGLR